MTKRNNGATATETELEQIAVLLLAPSVSLTLSPSSVDNKNSACSAVVQRPVKLDLNILTFRSFPIRRACCVCSLLFLLPSSSICVPSLLCCRPAIPIQWSLGLESQLYCEGERAKVRFEWTHTGGERKFVPRPSHHHYS